MGSSLAHRQICQRSESEPQTEIRSHLSQPHHPLGSDRGGATKGAFRDLNLGHLNTFLCGSQTVSKDNLQIEGGKNEQGHALKLRV